MKEEINPKVFSKQIEFISDLTKRLKNDIDCEVDYELSFDSNSKVHTLHNHSRIQDDIKRIRRELMDLSNMLNW